MTAYRRRVLNSPASGYRAMLVPIWLLAVACVWLGGCADSGNLEPLSADATIVAFGDSLTAGVGASSSGSYPEVLAALVDRRVINAGVSGETTQEGRQRLGEVLEQHHPDLLILLEGGNDILRNHSSQETEANLEAMIELARSHSVPVLLVGVPEKSLFSYAAPFYEELATRHSLAYEGRILGTLMRDSDMKSDPIHFNDDGYRALAEAIVELMKNHGAL